VERLVFIYAEQQRFDDAARVLDAARTAAGDEPDLLYSLSHLYGVIDRPHTTNEVLQQVIELDPTHAPAANDLGYSWADEGIHLQRAEELVRLAVKTEPDNHSFLDSLGWVLYKRGDFEPARRYLQQAVDEAV